VIYSYNNSQQPIPLAARSKAWLCGRLVAGIVGSNPAGVIDVSYECCVLSGRGICEGPIPLLEESYGVYVCVIKSDQRQL